MNKQRAFTLIESLVAIVVLSLGVLGVVAMQAKALQSSHAAYQRTLASIMAKEAEELLWANYRPECPDASSLTTEWIDIWDAVLPIVPPVDHEDMSSGGSGIYRIGSAGPECVYAIRVTWRDERFKEEGGVVNLTYLSRLPFSMNNN